MTLFSEGLHSFAFVDGMLGCQSEVVVLCCCTVHGDVMQIIGAVLLVVKQI